MSHIAFVFPGQGSQSVGMANDFLESYDSVKATFNEASNALGFDMLDLIQNDPAGQLNQTAFTQPAILTVSIAVWRQFQQESKVKPSYFAGHSLGEYSALVAAGVLSFSDAVKLVHLRGQLMQKAVPEGEGKMAAILGLSDEEVVAGCEEAAQGDVVAAVNFNTPGQVVIAGQAAAVERAIDVLKAKGAKRAMPLPVSVPSHCALMKPAAEALADAMAELSFAEPNAPVVQNRSAEAVSDVSTLRQNLIEQLYMPVLWTRTVESLASAGVTEIIEAGPGKVLTGLNKRIAKDATHTTLNDVAAFRSRMEIS